MVPIPARCPTAQTGVGGGEKPRENSRLRLGERRTIGQKKGEVTGVPVSGLYLWGFFHFSFPEFPPGLKNFYVDCAPSVHPRLTGPCPVLRPSELPPQGIPTLRAYLG